MLFRSAMASLKGEVNSGINISGSMSNPLIDGGIEIDDGAVHIGYANADYRLDTAAIIIRNSIIDFYDYKIWAYNNNPLTINGDFDMRDFSDMKLDLSIRGSNIELINVKNQKGQMVYGKMNMNVLTTIKGPVNLLNINGRLDLLSGTDITYVMLDSHVSAQNRISNLVDFTSFSDSANYIPTGLKKPAISGIDMIMTISISTGVKLGINLSANGDDRVELIGGGDLAFQMTPMGSMDMTGRYNLNGGFVRYNLPVLPVAKTFNIISGSYVDWSGDLLDPYINITAGEKIRTSVTESDKGTRVVNFEALIHITNKLNDLKIVFDVEAPDDLTIENQLASMTSEERSKQADRKSVV